MSLELIQPDYNNDFNYPSLSRRDLMYLDSINSRDCPIRKINQINSNRDWSTNLYNLDIEKSVPKKNSIFINKTDFINKLDDIEKARPNKDVILNKPNYNLDISDIERAHPKNLYWNSKRHVNPLNPVYKLPSFVQMEPDPGRKFIRDQIDISDIEKSKPNKLYPLKMRPFKNYEEIKGVHPRKPYERKEIYDCLNYSDINIKKSKFRNTNPLEPLYDKPYDGIIEGTKPFLYYYNFIDDNKNTLKVDDIKGTAPGSLNHYSNFRYDNKQRFDTRDIDGAFADTKKYGINTKRCTNPLKPNYQYIGNNEIFDCFGEMINNGKLNRKNNKLNSSMMNPKVKTIDEYNNEDYMNKFKYNNSSNLAYSHDFYNYPKSDRRNRKMVKSLSCEEVNSKLPLFTLKKNIDQKNSIKYNILRENEKNENKDNYFKKPYPNYELNHDSTLKTGVNNKNNRLDVRLKKMKRNQNIRDLRRNIYMHNNYNDMSLKKINNSDINMRMNYNDLTEIINNGMSPLYNKLGSKDECYENKIDDLIKANKNHN